MQNSIPTILITGTSGLIGSNFLRLLPTRASTNGKLELTDGSLYGQIVCPPHNQMDISNIRQVKRYFQEYKPSTIVHFAAYRDATSAELERGNHDALVWKTNVVGVKNLAKLCCETDAHFIHISTDMVFSGKEINPGPYLEYSQTEKNEKNLSWYGWTKKLGEEIVQEYCNSYAIIRIGNVSMPVYDPKLDYIGKIVWLYNNSSLYPLFDDQKISLTYVPDLANVIKSLLLNWRTGIFHVASKDLVSPFALAQYTITRLGGDSSLISNCSIDDYLSKFPNRYPKFGGLSPTITEQTLNMNFCSWSKIADNFVEYMRIMNLS